jgi:hypothetical protein
MHKLLYNRYHIETKNNIVLWTWKVHYNSYITTLSSIIELDKLDLNNHILFENGNEIDLKKYLFENPSIKNDYKLDLYIEKMKLKRIMNII